MRKFLGVTGVFLAVVLIGSALGAGITGIFTQVNSVNGYQVNGAGGSSGQVLSSNGTYYNTPLTPYTPPSNACSSYSSSAIEGCLVTVNGYWVEWGFGPTESANYFGTQTFTLPVTFPHACFTVQLSTSTPSPISGNGAAYTNYLQSCTTTTVTFSMDVGPDGVGTVNHSTMILAVGN